jgi:predicted component of type VI protein secretion system
MNLVIEDEAGTRSIVPFASDSIVVGRGAEVTFRLADRNVSRRHARFVRQSGVVFVEDLGSLTGTRVNGERITGRRRLREGDLVQIGEYDLAVLADGQAVAPGAPPPLPSGAPRADLNATSERLPVEPTPPAPIAAPPASAALQPGGDRRIGVVLTVAVVALALGLAAGWATGALVP